MRYERAAGRQTAAGSALLRISSLGAVADWLHRTVAGLAPAAPGYRRLRIAPRPGGALTHAEAKLLTPYGVAEVAWTLNGDQLTINALIPPNTTADVDLPGGEGEQFEAGSGHHTWHVPFARESRQAPAVSLDSTVGDLMDHPVAMRVFRETLIRHLPEAAAYIDQADASSTAVTVRQVGAMVPGGEQFLADLQEQFAALT